MKTQNSHGETGARPTREMEALLEAAGRLEPAALRTLFELVYPDLHRLAEQHAGRESPGGTIGPTVMVHEVYMRLAKSGFEIKKRAEFFAAASLVMRHILVDRARSRGARKRREKEAVRQEMTEITPADEAAERMLALDRALHQLKETDPALEHFVVLRLFGGLGLEEAANEAGLHPRTAQRRWQLARARLRDELDGPHEPATR